MGQTIHRFVFRKAGLREISTQYSHILLKLLGRVFPKRAGLWIGYRQQHMSHIVSGRIRDCASRFRKEPGRKPERRTVSSYVK